MPVRVLVCSNKLNTIWFYVIIKSLLFIDLGKPQTLFSAEGKSNENM